MTSVARDPQCRPADVEAVAAGKDQVQRPAVGADPLGREAARLAGADVPLRLVSDRRPRPPRLRRVEDAEAGLHEAVGPRLAQQVALQPGAVADGDAVALARV